MFTTQNSKNIISKKWPKAVYVLYPRKMFQAKGLLNLSSRIEGRTQIFNLIEFLCKGGLHKWSFRSPKNIESGQNPCFLPFMTPCMHACCGEIFMFWAFPWQNQSLWRSWKENLVIILTTWASWGWLNLAKINTYKKASFV